MKKELPNKQLLSKLGFILVSAGAAVGIGNIWRFPYLVAENGGGTFIVAYLFFAFIIGMSTMLSEYVIGRYLGHPFIQNIKEKLKFSTFFSKAIYLNLIISLTLISFYFVVTGWTFYYFFNSLVGLIEYSPNLTKDYYLRIFESLLSNPLTLIGFSIVVTLSTITINLKGLVSGVEKANFIFLPILFILLLILIIRILSLDNAIEGLKYIFAFDISKLSGAIIPALGQALFSLSVGLGTMIVFASHTSKEHNLTSSTISTVILGSIIGIFASFLIIPALFVFGYGVDSGPGLTFLTLPSVFGHLYLGQLFAIIFFLIMSMAALTSTIAIIETSIPYVEKLFNIKRNPSIIVLGFYCLISNIIMSLSLNVLSDVKIFNMNLFDFFSGDFLNIILIVGTILIAIILGFGISKESIKKELTSNGALKFRAFGIWRIYAVFLSPIIISIAIIYSIFG